MSIGIRSSGHFRYGSELAQVAIDETNKTYSTKLITFELFGFTTTESAFVDQVRQLLLHELVNLSNSFLKA